MAGETSAKPDREHQKASREAGIYAYSRVAASVLLLLTLVVGARVYSKPEFAFVSAILLLYETAMALGSLGLADAVFYFIGRNPTGARLIVRQTTFLLGALSIPVIAVTMAGGWIMSNSGFEMVSEHGQVPGAGFDLVPILPWLALVLVIELPTQPAVNQLIASGHATLASGLFVGLATLRTIALLLPGIVGWEVDTVPMIMAVTGLTRLVAHVAIVRRFFPLERLDTGQAAWLRRPALREIMLFALPAGAAVIAGKLNPQIDKYAVGLLLSKDDFANYSAAAYELPLITLVPYAIAAVMQARYVKLYMAARIDDLRDLWFATVRKTALLVVPLTTMIIALGEEAIMVIAGAKYANAALPFQIFTLVILHRVAAYSSMLQAVGQPRAVMVSAFLLLGCNALLAWPMTELLGYPGPAIASVIAIVPAWLFVLSRIGAVLGGGVRGALPWRFYARVLALAGVIGAGVWLLAHHLPVGPGARLGIGAAIYLAAFIPLGRLTGLIHREDLGFLGNWLTLRMLRKPADPPPPSAPPAP